MPDPAEIKEEEAGWLFFIIFMLPRLVSLGLITQDQADQLRPVLNDRLHEALDLD